MTAPSLGPRTHGSVYSLSEWSLSPTALRLSPDQAAAPQPDVLGARLPGAGAPGWGARGGAQTCRSLGRSPVIVTSLSPAGHPGVWAPPTHLLVAPSLCL